MPQDLQVTPGKRGPALSLAQARVVGRVANLIKATYKTDRAYAKMRGVPYTGEETPLFSKKLAAPKLRLVPSASKPKKR